jgi:hypothetical protein
MTTAYVAFFFALIFSVLYIRYRSGLNLSLTTFALSAIFLFHGPVFLYYLWVEAPDSVLFGMIMLGKDYDRIISNLMLSIAWAMCGMMLGYEIAMRFGGKDVARAEYTSRNWEELTPQSRFDTTGSLLPISLMAVGLCGAFLVIDNQIYKAYLFFFFDGSEQDKIGLRREFGGSATYMYNLALSCVIPFLTIACLVSGFIRKNKSLIFLGIVLSTLATIGKMSTLSKAPVAIFFIQLVMARILYKRQRWSTQNLLVIALAMILSLAVATAAMNPDLQLDEIFEFLFYRAFLIGNEGLVEYFAAIPDAIPHNWGQQIGIISSLLGLIGEAAETVPTYFQVGAIARGAYGSTTTVMFIGDAWADFAAWGVVFFPVLAGIIIKSIDLYALRNGKTDEAIALLVAGYYGVFIALSTSLQTALLTGGLLLVPVLSKILTTRNRSGWELRSSHGPVG